MNSHAGKTIANFNGRFVELKNNCLVFKLPEHNLMNPCEIADILHQLERNRQAVTLTISERFKPKDVDSVRFIWATCKEIAENVGYGTTDVDVYKKVILETTNYEQKTWSKAEFEHEKEKWERQGKGWFVEIAEDLGDEFLVHAYYGMSRYSSKEMGRLIESIAQEADCTDVPLYNEDAIEHIKDEWEPVKKGSVSVG